MVFSSLAPLHKLRCFQHGDVAQLVRAGLLYSQGRGFKSRLPYKALCFINPKI